MDISVNGRTVNVSTLATSDIVATYNELAFELGEPSVNRFANRSKAESRLVAVADRHAAMLRNRCGTEAPVGAAEPVTLVQKHTADGASVLVKPTQDPVLVSQTITPSADGHSVTVDTQVTVQLDGSDKAQIKAEAAARTPVAEGAPRWAKPKQEAASKTAYRPRPNSSQQRMYDMLTREPNGIDIEEFCAAMKDEGDKTLHQPSTVWSCLRYLFVTSKGYGLNFDGHNLRLIVPQDEREAIKATKAKAA